MSSIAYATDEKMLEYHRLCGSRNVNFWRLSSRTAFSDFERGDLLFFYAKGLRGRKKGLVGYGHFDSAHVMSLKKMWNKYGVLNGYDRMVDMQEAIAHASRNHQIPDKMGCLYLTDVVFFRTPVYPEHVGITINEKLESFTYLDKDDPQVTVRILQEAEKNGIDVWSSTQSSEPEYIFAKDELAYQLALICHDLGKDSLSAAEEKRAKHLMHQKTSDSDAELIRGSSHDAFSSDGTELKLYFPFVCNAYDREEQIRSVLGKMMFYRIRIKLDHLRIRKTVFCLLSDAPYADIEKMADELNKL